MHVMNETVHFLNIIKLEKRKEFHRKNDFKDQKFHEKTMEKIA